MGTACLRTKTPSKLVAALQWILGVLNPSAFAFTSLSRSSAQGRVDTPCGPVSGLPLSKRCNGPHPHSTHH